MVDVAKLLQCLLERRPTTFRELVQCVPVHQWEFLLQTLDGMNNEDDLLLLRMLVRRFHGTLVCAGRCGVRSMKDLIRFFDACAAYAQRRVDMWCMSLGMPDMCGGGDDEEKKLLTLLILDILERPSPRAFEHLADALDRGNRKEYAERVRAILRYFRMFCTMYE